MPEVGSLFVSLGLSTAAFDRGIKETTHKLDGFGRRIKEVSGGLGKAFDNINFGKAQEGFTKLGAGLASLKTTLAGTAAVFGIEQIVSWVKSMADAGEATVNLATNLGMPLDKMVEMQGMFQLTEGSAEEASTSILKFGASIQEAIKDPTSKAAEAFKVFGLSIAQLKTVVNDPIAALRLLGEAQAKFADDSNKSLAIRELTGKSMATLRPLLSGVAEDYDGLREKIRRLDPDGVKFAETANDTATKIDIMSLAITGLIHTAFVAFAPTINAAIDNMEKFREKAIAVGAAISGLVTIMGEMARFVGEIAKVEKTISDRARAAGVWTREKIAQGKDWWEGAPEMDAEAVPGKLNMSKLQEQADKARLRPALPPTPTMGGGGKGGRGGGGGGGGGKDKAAESRMSAWQDELEQKLLAERKFFGDSDEMELAFWNEKLKLAEKGSKEWLAVRRKVFDLEKSLAMKAQRDAIDTLEHQQQIDDARLARKRQQIEQQVGLDKLTAAEGLDAEVELLDQKWQADAAYYEKKLAAAQGDTDKQRDLYRQQAVDYENFLTERERTTGQKTKSAYDKIKEGVEGAASVIESSLGSAFDKLVEGTFNLRNAIGGLLKDMGKWMASAAFKSLFKMGGNALTTSLGGMVGAAPAVAAATGTSFRVGGSGGIDSQVVSIRATPDELIDVRPNTFGGNPGGRADVVTVNLNPSEGWVSGIADQQIRTHSGSIVRVAVAQSQSTTRRSFSTLARESGARQA